MHDNVPVTLSLSENNPLPSGKGFHFQDSVLNGDVEARLPLDALAKDVEDAVLCDADTALIILSKMKNWKTFAELQFNLSVATSMCGSNNDLVSSTALATVQSIIFEVEPHPENRISLIDVFPSLKQDIQEPKDNLLFIYVNELSMIIQGQSTEWIFVSTPSKSYVYEILEMIINNCENLYQKTPLLSSVLESTLIPSISDPDAVEYMISFVRIFCEKRESLIAAIVSEFAGEIAKGSIQSLLFFHSLCVEKTPVIGKVLSSVDKSTKDMLLNGLAQKAADLKLTKPISIQMKKFNLHSLKVESNKTDFLNKAVFEIMIGIVTSYNEQILSLPCTQVLLTGVHFSTTESLTPLFDAILIAFERSDHSEALLHFFIESEPYDLSDSDKKEKWHSFLGKLISDHTETLESYWNYIIDVAVISKHIPLSSFSFTKVNSGVLNSIVAYLVSRLPETESLIPSLVSTNTARIECFWSSLSELFTSHNHLPLFVEILGQSFDAHSEAILFGTAYSLIVSDCLPAHKELIMSQMKSIVNKTTPVDTSLLFKLLDPSNFVNSPDAMSDAFETLTQVSRTIALSTTSPLIQIIFQYVNDQSSVNLSLSSLGLIWSIAKHFNEGDWKSYIDNTFNTIFDERSEIAVAAVKTLFSILSANFPDIPESVHVELVGSLLEKLISQFAAADQSKQQVLSSIISEEGAYVCNFWSYYEKIETFTDELIPLLIEKATIFVNECVDESISVTTLDVYVDIIACPSSDRTSLILVRDAIINLISNFAQKTQENQNETFIQKIQQKTFPSVSIDRPVISNGIGRIICNSLSLLKERQMFDILSEYMMVVECLCQTFPSGPNRVHITSQRVIDSIPSLFPVPQETEAMIIRILAKIAWETRSYGLLKEVVATLVTIFSEKPISNKIAFISECQYLSDLEEASPLFELFVIENVDNNDSEVYFDLVMELQNHSVNFSETVSDKLIKLLPNVQKEKQKQFMKKFSDNLDVIFSVWSKYFSPDSSEFDMEMFKTCEEEFVVSLEVCMSAVMKEASSKLFDSLSFLADATLPPKNVGRYTECNQWHLVIILPHLAELVSHESASVRSVLKIAIQKAGIIANTAFGKLN